MLYQWHRDIKDTAQNTDFWWSRRVADVKDYLYLYARYVRSWQNIEPLHERLAGFLQPLGAAPPSLEIQCKLAL